MPSNPLAVAAHSDDDLRDIEERHRSWFVHNPLPMWIFDSETLRFVEVNEAAVRQYGYSRQEFLAMTIKDIRLPEDIPALLELMCAPYQDRTQMVMARHRTKSGHLLQVEVYAQQDIWAGRHAELVQIHDITERQRAEQELRNLSNRLLQSQDEQKRRMARELHDAVGQSLAALLANLAIISRAAEGFDAKARKTLEECVGLAEHTCNEIRTLSYLLHPPLLDEEGLAAALDLYADGFSQRSGIHVDVKVPAGLGRMSQDTETAVFRIVQEALTNIHRHSESASAEVRVVRAAGSVVLEVRDHGRGMRPDVLERVRRGGASVGVGITGMRERVAQLGGRFEVESSSQGTGIRAVLPFTACEA
jgi:PAS domain S-box-containing protein